MLQKKRMFPLISSLFLLLVMVVIVVAIIKISATAASIETRMAQVEAKLSEMAIITSNNNDRVSTPVAPVIRTKEIVKINLEITDTGFLPADLEISADKISQISVTNSGQKSHSLVIDELNIDTDIIFPGETREFVIARDFNKPQAFTFHSNADGDDPQTFKGILMVTK